jgi:heme-degrading monooxygenase HmoA
MISRHWKGIAKPGQADNYRSHLKNDTFPKLSAIEGFVRACILTRVLDQGTEFLIITVWQSMEAIERFAGVPADMAVVPPVVQAMMVEYDRKVIHYDVADTQGPSGTSTEPITHPL